MTWLSFAKNTAAARECAAGPEVVYPLALSVLRQRVQMSNSRSHVRTSPPASSMRHPLVVQ